MRFRGSWTQERCAERWRRAALGAMTLGLGALDLTNFILAAQKNACIPCPCAFSIWAPWCFCRRWPSAFGSGTGSGGFFRLFCPLALVGTVLYAIPVIIWGNPSSWTLAMLQPPQTLVCMTAAFLSAVAEWGHGEVVRRAEARLLNQRNELAQSSYEAMLRQYDEVMALHHDMMKHFLFLRQTTSDAKTAEYLNKLIGQNKKSALWYRAKMK